MQLSMVSGGSRAHSVRLFWGAANATILVITTAACGVADVFIDEKVPTAGVDIVPEAGGSQIQPDKPISVHVRHGKLQDVTVKNKGAPVEGRTAANGGSWQSRWGLRPDTNYEVTATALGRDGRTKSTTSSFATLKAAETFRASLEAPNDEEKVGVGMPIILSFNRDIVNKAAVERALEVRMSTPVEGAWHWEGKKRVIFRTREYWPKGQRIHFTAHLSGVKADKNVYGDADEKARFRVGDKIISKVDTEEHEMVVERNGEEVREMPISAGRSNEGTYATTSGVHLTMSMEPHVLMVGPGYRTPVDDAVRISNSGIYVHGAPWSVGSQGSANVSHGCVNASPDDASWYMEQTHRGDIVDITGTERELEWDNGWGYWQMPWKEWVAGGAVKRAINPGAAAPKRRPAATPKPSPTGSPTASPSDSSSAPSREAGTPAPPSD